MKTNTETKFDAFPKLVNGDDCRGAYAWRNGERFARVHDSGEEPNWIERTALDVVWLLLALCCILSGPIALIAVLMISSGEEKRS